MERLGRGQRCQDPYACPFHALRTDAPGLDGRADPDLVKDLRDRNGAGEHLRGHRHPGARGLPPVVHAAPLVGHENGDGVVGPRYIGHGPTEAVGREDGSRREETGADGHDQEQEKNRAVFIHHIIPPGVLRKEWRALCGKG